MAAWRPGTFDTFPGCRRAVGLGSWQSSFEAQDLIPASRTPLWVKRELKSWVQRHTSLGNRQKTSLRNLTTHPGPPSSQQLAKVPRARRWPEKSQGPLVLACSSAFLRMTLTQFAIPNQLRLALAAGSTQGGNQESRLAGPSSRPSPSSETWEMENVLPAQKRTPQTQPLLGMA